jgi:hypothetical protein
MHDQAKQHPDKHAQGLKDWLYRTRETEW